MTARIRITINRVNEVKRAIAEVADKRVLVGIPSTTAGRRSEGDDGPLTNAEIGYIHEFGSPDANIPARPVLIPGVSKAREQIADRFGRTMAMKLKGESVSLPAELEKIGMVAVNAVKREFVTADLAPLAQMTLERRQARGRKGTRPLIDTGQYRQAMTYVVR